MVKNSFKLIFFTHLFIIYSLLSASFSWAAVLRWSPVASTVECEIAGYNIYYGTTSVQYTNFVDVAGQDNTSCDLDTLNLVADQTYYFAVSAYSTTHQEGPLSLEIRYTVPPSDEPYIIQYPLVDHAENIIDVEFSESNMLGADNKNSYEFIPTIFFDSDHSIERTGRTYRLFLEDIPGQIIFSMTVSSVTDIDGNPLVSNSITLNDNDNDYMADDWEAYYGITTAFGDPDEDDLDNRLEFGLRTNPVDNDSDNDGMPDGWEYQNGLNPVIDDAGGDIDGDGLTNIEEYRNGSGVSNRRPEKPVLNQPADSSDDIELNVQLGTNPYVDQEDNTHIKTQWQISTEASFTISENIIYERETYKSTLLTSLTVPESLLMTGETYFWRVKFFDDNSASLWSESFSFSTITINPDDADGNGVPDIQQVMDGTIDLNNDGNSDVSSDSYKMASNGNTSFALEISNNVTSVVSLKAIDPDDISDNFGKPDNLSMGLIHFKIRVNNPGDEGSIRIYFSEPVGPDWYKYDSVNGWSEFSGSVNFSSDRKSVLLSLVDGGEGDSDGVANGIIVDPSGPGGSGSSGFSGSPSGSGSSGGSGCFIATAAFGSPMEKHVQILKEFRDVYLLKSRAGIAFVNAYYKYSPPIADVIARHGVLRSVVRIGLMPLICFGYLVVYASVIQQIMILMISLIIMATTIMGTRYLIMVNN